MDPEGGASMIYWCYSLFFDGEPPMRVEAASDEDAAVKYVEYMMRIEADAACPSVCIAEDEESAFNGTGVNFKIQWSAKAVR